MAKITVFWIGAREPFSVCPHNILKKIKCSVGKLIIKQSIKFNKCNARTENSYKDWSDSFTHC